jgi:hypothetical protein
MALAAAKTFATQAFTRTDINVQGNVQGMRHPPPER